MKLDLVHDIQKAYRKVVDSMSRPGLIGNLAEEALKVDLEIGCFPSTVVLALMLLDTEVTFKVFSEREAEIAKWFNQITYAKSAEAEKADYIFVLNDAVPHGLEHALQLAKTGDLVNPHESATIIVETVGVRHGDAFILTGPGIAGERRVTVEAPGNWVKIRAEKNAEYPMGIDLIFLDPGHHLLCLPRTTQIRKRAVR